MEYPILEKIIEGEKFETIFEVGCASGVLLASLQRDRVGRLILGGMDKIKPENPPTPFLFLEGDAREVPWPIEDKSWDLVYTCGMLMYVEDPVPVIKEMFRIGKRVVIAEPVVPANYGTDHHGDRYYRDYHQILAPLCKEIEPIVLLDKVIYKCK